MEQDRLIITPRHSPTVHGLLENFLHEDKIQCGECVSMIRQWSLPGFQGILFLLPQKNFLRRGKVKVTCYA